MNKTIVPDFVPESLKTFFENHSKLALAFSGGCDSAYLMRAAVACGINLRAYYVHSRFQPAFELADARRLAEECGCEMRIIEVDVLADERVRANPADRCYYCKQRIFSAILSAAKEDGYTAVMDGTNASDDASDRPGMRALREMQVLSPLRECGITKAQVRAYSKMANLFTWDKPAYACLATRVPGGMEIRADLLEKVERGEEALAKLGFSGFRLRLTQTGARLEITEDQFPLLVQLRKDVLSALENDFFEITLNLKPRKGLET